MMGLTAVAGVLFVIVLVLLVLRIVVGSPAEANLSVSPSPEAGPSATAVPEQSTSPTPVTATTSPTSTPTPTPSPTRTPTATPTPAPWRTKLSGEITDAASVDRRPIAVMIDNFPDAIPQYGLSKASVVFEVLAEGGLTRFMPVFETSDLEQIGPVRSARLYYVDWSRSYGALLVHAGGSPAAMDLFEADPSIPHLNLLYVGWPSWRDEENRYAPHNLFTSGALMEQFMEEWEIPRESAYDGFVHKDEAPKTGRPRSSTIEMVFSPLFSEGVRWEYDRDTNCYLRYQWGDPHIDALTGEQLRAKNVVVIFTPQWVIPGDDAGRMEVQTTGTGESVLFQDGESVKGTWEKASIEEPLRLYDAAGKPMALNPGVTWIAVLPLEAELSYGSSLDENAQADRSASR